MKIEKLISADSHVVEPPDLWQERIDARYRHRAPRMIHDNGIDRWIVDESIAIGSTGAPSQAGRRYEDKESLSIEAAFADTPKAAWDPDARVVASDLDGVTGEVVFPTIAVRMVETNMASDLLSACFRAANDWMADFTGAHPKRLKGTCLLNVDDVDEAVAELERCLVKGAAAACIPAYPGEGRTYDLPRCERLWAAAQDAGIPIVMHTGSYRPGPGVIGSFANDISAGGTSSFRASEDYWARRAIGDMMFSGVFERFPRLRVGAVEFELGWAPYFIQTMDRHYEEHRYVKEIRFEGERMPSDFFHENVFVTFQEDVAGIMTRHITGVDNIMWGSDFPHTESTWPRSREVLAKLLEDVPDDEVARMTYGNAARVFGFD